MVEERLRCLNQGSCVPIPHRSSLHISPRYSNACGIYLCAQHSPCPQHLHRTSSPSHRPYEKLTNFGSLGLPSGPILFFANRPSVYIRLASSNPTLRFRMIFWISFLLASSSPARESPAATLPDRSKAEDDRPASMSLEKEEGSRL